MAFEKYTTPQLKKSYKVLLIISIVALLVMCFLLGMGLYQTSHGKNSSLIYLVPTVMGPLAIFPSVFAAMIGSEVKRRGKNKQ